MSVYEDGNKAKRKFDWKSTLLKKERQYLMNFTETLKRIKHKIFPKSIFNFT